MSDYYIETEGEGHPAAAPIPLWIKEGDGAAAPAGRTTPLALIVFVFLSSKAKIMCSSICKCIGCKNFEESPERKTLMHLADAAEVRVQQQTAAKTKLSSQISDLLMRTTPVISTGSGRWGERSCLKRRKMNKDEWKWFYLSSNRNIFHQKRSFDLQIHKQSTYFRRSDAIFLL